MEERFFTGVGSREAPAMYVRFATAIAKKAEAAGFKLRTGDATGMDEGFRNGTHPSNRVVFSAKPKPGCICGPQLPNWQDAYDIAKSIHPAWERCSPFAKLLHGRNPYQVLGEDLQTPSEFVALYAKPKGDKAVSGGTNTAYQVAVDWGIPIFNIYFKEEVNALFKFLDEIIERNKNDNHDIT